MMTFEEAFNQTPGNGWLTVEEARLLWDSALAAPYGPILEVGVYQGRSTCLLACLERPLWCVDPFFGFDSNDQQGHKTRDIWERNVRDRGFNNVTLFPVHIEQWPTQHVPITFAYLDGDHTYQGTQAQIGAALLAGAEHMCIHDYATSGGGLEVKRAIEDTNLKIKKIVGRMVYCTDE